MISSDTVRKVAATARLELTDAEIAKFSRDLSDILAAFRDLDKVQTDEKPSFQPLEIRDVLRGDVAENGLSQEQALSNTKHRENGFFRGPRAV